jgi:hypothetical protein
MKTLMAILLTSLLYPWLLAQESTISEGAKTITIDELRDHIYYLASDELEGRFPGTPGFEKAKEYIVTQLRQAGLSPICRTSDSKLSYYQNLTINKYSPGTDNRITIIKKDNESTFTLENDFIINYGGPYDIKDLYGGLAFVGAGIKEPDYGIDDFKKIDLRGKWAVVSDLAGNLPKVIENKLIQEVLKKYGSSTEKRRIIEQNVKDAGAIGIINIPTTFKLNTWNKNAMRDHFQYSLTEIGLNSRKTSLCRVSIDSSMAEYLFNGEVYNPINDKGPFKTFEFKNSKLRLQKEYSLSYINSSNIVAFIEGSDPILKNEYITLGAHLDHYGIQNNQVMNGANDNASGCAGVIEIAEALTKTKLKRSLICIFYTKEESGLLGSYYFTENPPVPLENIIVNINLDMIGRSETNAKGLAPIAANRITPKLKDLISNVNNKNSPILLDWEYAENGISNNSGSDHFPFHLKKIPAVYFNSGDDSDYHKPSDDPDKINYEFFQKNCQLIYEIVLELANGDNSLKD